MPPQPLSALLAAVGQGIHAYLPDFVWRGRDTLSCTLSAAVSTLLAASPEARDELIAKKCANDPQFATIYVYVYECAHPPPPFFWRLAHPSPCPPVDLKSTSFETRLCGVSTTLAERPRAPLPRASSPPLRSAQARDPLWNVVETVRGACAATSSGRTTTQRACASTSRPRSSTRGGRLTLCSSMTPC